MAKNLLIVESPAKAKTINKYLGKDFTVLASYGHVRDLVPKEGAVDPENGFAMRYDLIEKNEKHVEAIAKAAKSRRSPVPGDRPGSRGRGDQLAHRRDPARARPDQGQAAAPGGVHRDHPARDQGSDGAATRHRSRPGRCAAGTARTGLPGRLQPVAGAVAQGPGRAVGRARAIAGAAHDRGARGRDRSVQDQRVLEHRSRSRASLAGLHRAHVQARWQEIRHRHQEPRLQPDQWRGRRSGACPRGRRCRRRAACHRRRQQGTQAPAVATIHHLDPAAGRRAQARLHHPQDHAGRAEAL